MTNEKKDQPAVKTRKVQMIGIEAELAQDIRDALRKLPVCDVEQLLKRLTQSQVLNVDVTY